MFGFDAYPILVTPHTQGFKVALTKDTAWTVVEQLFYRQDVTLKYEDHSFAKNVSGRLQKAERGKDKQRRVEIPTSLGKLLSMNAFAHFKAVAPKEGVVTAPAGVLDAFAKPLEDMLYGIGDDGDKPNVQAVQQDQHNEDDEPPAKRQRRQAEEMIVQRAEDVIVEDRVCLRVVHTGVGRMKSISSFVKHTDAKLKVDDVAVTFHDELPTSTEDKLVRVLRPRLQNGLARGPH